MDSEALSAAQAAYLVDMAKADAMDLVGETRQTLELVDRHFTQAEWQQYFSDEPYRPTCSDLRSLAEPSSVQP